MGIFDDIKAKGAAYRLTEEALYAEALREIESGQRRDGIWAKAMSESDMDQGKAGAKYIRLRVQSLKDEITVFMAGLNRAASEVPKHLPPNDEDTNYEPEQSTPHSTSGRLQKILLALLLGVLVICLVLGGIFYYLSLLRAAAAEDGESSALELPAYTLPKTPIYFPLDSMVVNLADPGGEKVAQVGITLEIINAQSIQEVRKILPVIRPLALTLISQRTSTELLSAEGKKKLTDEILALFGKKGNSPVGAVLYSSFIVQ